MPLEILQPMHNFSDRLSEVENHFQQEDLSLGYRRLIDCALDIGQPEFYQKIIHYSDEFYDPEISDQQKKEKGLLLLDELKNYPAPLFLEETVLLSTDHVEKAYTNRKFKLHPISFNLKSRQIVGLVGENGNGKTTLLRLICGELAPTNGTINYSFSAVKAFSFELKSELIYIPQRIEILYGTLMDNLQFTLSSHGVLGEENVLLAKVMLARFGLWTYKDLNWSQLSSGYKMRFELVRTLLRKPKVLLLDEPLANLDILAQQIILEDLKYLAQSYRNPIGIILSSQQLYEVEKVSDEVIFLELGQLKKNTQEEQETPAITIVEIDIQNSKEDLLAVLEPIGLHQLKYNGGSYIAYFDGEVRFATILKTLGESQLIVSYIRNISSSSRRFFVN